MRKNAGVTLVEILLAIIVMAIGLVGVLALFPPALAWTKESTDETQAAIMAESVHHCLCVALQNAQLEVLGANANRYKVVMTHDFRYGSLANMSDIYLPLIDSGWTHYPGGGAAPDPGIATGGTPESQPKYDLGSDAWVVASVDDPYNKNSDATDPYKQFTFSVDVKKVETLNYIINPPLAGQEREERNKLYEFIIHVFRKRIEGSAGAGGETGGITTVTGGGAATGLLVQTLRCKIAVR